MSTIFFEVEDWEQDSLKRKFPDAILSPEKLTEDNAAEYSSAQLVSTFIYSTVTKQVLQAMPGLKFIATRSTGYDHIDLAACTEKGIRVANVPEYGSNTVAEHTFALLLSLTRRIYESVSQSKRLNFEHNEIRGVDLYGKTLGIIGLGKIGMNVMRIAQGFGMKVLVYNHRHDEELAKKAGFQYADLELLLRESDAVTLHLPLLPDTTHIINKTNILLFKRGSYLLNTARGGLIDTEAVMLGLDRGILAGVGLDVLEEEKELSEEAAILSTAYRQQLDLKTLVYDHMLINHPKVLITPHNAFNSEEALMRILNTTIDNITAYLDGRDVNLVKA